VIRTGKRVAIASYSSLIAWAMVAEVAYFVDVGSPEPFGPLLAGLNGLLLICAFKGKQWSRYVGGLLNGFLAIGFLSVGNAPIEEVLLRAVCAFWLAVPSLLLMLSTSVSVFVASRESGG
jgi:hypothetical protein